MFETCVSAALNCLLQGNYFSHVSVFTFHRLFHKQVKGRAALDSDNCWNTLPFVLETLGFTCAYLTKAWDILSLSEDNPCAIIVYSTLPVSLNVYRKEKNHWYNSLTKQIESSSVVQTKIQASAEENETFNALLICGLCSSSLRSPPLVMGESEEAKLLDPHFSHERKSFDASQCLSSASMLQSDPKGYMAKSVRDYSLVDGIKDYAIYQLDRQGCIMSWNEGARLLKGYKEEEVIGKHFSIFYTPEEIQAKRPQLDLEEAIAKDRIERECWRVRKDNTRFWAHFAVTCMRSPDNEVVGFAEITNDHTATKQAQEKLFKQQEMLVESEERQRLLIDSVIDYAIFQLSADGAICSWNSGAERLKGYTSEEIIGKHFSVFYPALDVATGKPQRELEIAIAQGKFEEEGIRKRKDGSEFWANVVITAMRSKSTGELIGFAKVTRDMSERKKAQEKLLQQQHDLLITADRLKQETVAKTLFLQKLSHELRAPLSPVTLILSSFIDRYQRNSCPGGAESKEFPPQEVLEDMEVALKCIQRETMLIDDLLDTTRLGVGKMKLDIRQEDIHHLITELVCAIKRGEAQTKNISLSVDLQAKQHRANVDLHRMSQVFLNLFYNAVKFTPEGGSVTVSTRNLREAEQDLLEISIQDTGVGIEHEFQSKIFEMFTQGPIKPNVHSAANGLGLGLSIVRGILALHGGSIVATSDGLGKGSCFTIKLPVSQGKKPGKLPPAACPVPNNNASPPVPPSSCVSSVSNGVALSKVYPHGNSPGNSPLVAQSGLYSRRDRLLAASRKLHLPFHVREWNVLIVEDDAITLKLMLNFAKALGFVNVTSAASVQSAQQAIQDAKQNGKRFDLLISDINLPDGLGFDVMATLKSDEWNRCVGIVCSGSGGMDDVVKSNQAGFAIHLIKPIDSLKLTEAILALANAQTQQSNSTQDHMQICTVKNSRSPTPPPNAVPSSTSPISLSPVPPATNKSSSASRSPTSQA